MFFTTKYITHFYVITVAFSWNYVFPESFSVKIQ